MAKKEPKEKAIEVTLWEAANKLRGSVEPAEYKHVVLGLVFLKFASDKFEEHRTKLIAEKKEKYIEMPDFYNRTMKFTEEKLENAFTELLGNESFPHQFGITIKRINEQLKKIR